MARNVCRARIVGYAGCPDRTVRPDGGYVERLGSARQACSGIDDLHTLDEEPHCQPEFNDEARREPGALIAR